MSVPCVAFFRSFGRAFLCVSLLGSVQPMLNAQQELVSCKPASQKTGETGCLIIASQPMGVLAKPVYFTMETFGTRELGERKRGPVGTVVEALGEIWLLSVEPKRNSDPAGTRVTQIETLPSEAGQEYSAE